MHELHYLHKRDMPAAYQLSYTSKRTLCLRVQPELINVISSANPNAHIGLPRYTSFQPALASGYGDIFSPIDTESHEWISWECKLPSYAASSHAPDKVRAILATLSTVYLRLLHLPMKLSCATSWPQIFNYHLLVWGPYHGGALRVSASPYFVHELQTNISEQDITQITTLMNQVHAYMTGRTSSHVTISSSPTQVFSVLLGKNIRLAQDKARDESGMFNQTASKGIILRSQGVHNFFDLLTLLVGLASLEDIIRKST